MFCRTGFGKCFFGHCFLKCFTYFSAIVPNEQKEVETQSHGLKLILKVLARWAATSYSRPPSLFSFSFLFTQMNFPELMVTSLLMYLKSQSYSIRPVISRWENFCPPGYIWQCTETFLVTTSWRLLLASSGWKPRFC